MSGEIEYGLTTTEPCQANDCGGILLANRRHVFYRCPICFATYTRNGVEVRADSSDPALERRREEEAVAAAIQYTRVSNENCACGSPLHSSSDGMLYRCPDCQETYMRFGQQLVRDASIPRAIVIDRKKS